MMGIAVIIFIAIGVTWYGSHHGSSGSGEVNGNVRRDSTFGKLTARAIDDQFGEQTVSPQSTPI